MKNILPIPFNKIRFENLEEILKILKKALLQLGIDFYLIGAVARDIQLTGKYDIPTPRATLDIDIAILVNDQDSYNRLTRMLMDQYGFEDSDRPYRYKYTDIFTDEIFDRHADLLDEGWSDLLGARILGRHIGSILRKNGESRDKLTNLLRDQINEDSMLPELFARFNKKTIENNINLIREIITGVTE